jgi:hypothetical protein
MVVRASRGPAGALTAPHPDEPRRKALAGFCRLIGCTGGEAACPLARRKICKVTGILHAEKRASAQFSNNEMISVVEPTNRHLTGFFRDPTFLPAVDFHNPVLLLNGVHVGGTG